ncbi:HIT-like protein [Laetiporus sulphureus 93-53]|uniref:HIT-like protein n=1 Tax=Laetiporus sulphureus 93-53 TaxID=1314785 RepID=A0A165FW42_9APHY|nr:HIT-like protein [Laetiporus sulphureus 93-53]KZT09487.1 HIT-like protein [Laetiporus sulphureus 93-53]
MSRLTILRGYALRADPDKAIPASILLAHNADTITIFDAFPKSIFHLLVLPRVLPPFTVFELTNLRTLLKCDKARAKDLLDRLNETAKTARAMIEEEMMKRYGFKWGIWTGFHAVSSMEHLHLHVISSDLCSASMKVKKHYNSFNPKLGFFLPLDDIRSWFDAEPSYFAMMSQLKPSQYEPLLKEPLVCWRCDKEQKNMPTLKTHLQEEWDEEAKREKAKLERKRKHSSASQGQAGELADEETKKQHTESQ